MLNSCKNKYLLFVGKYLFYYQNVSSLMPPPPSIFTPQPDFDSSVTAPVNYTYKNHIQYFHIQNTRKFCLITIIYNKLNVFVCL